MKRCSTCHLDLPLEGFYHSSRSKDGLQGRCKDCQSEGRKSRITLKREAIRSQVPPPTGRRCPRCQTEKPFSEFSRHGAGYQTYCKPCSNLVRAEYKVRNADVLALRAAERVARTPEPTGCKTCTKCGVEKPLLSFYAHRGTKDGRAYYCMECQKETSRQWNRENAERVQERNAQYRAENGVQNARRNKQWWLKKYGLTEDDYEAMVERQHGVCAICLQPERYIDARTGLARRLAVDHDHKTFKVRGLLCGPCNRALGQYEDMPERLERAAAYLRSAMS